MTEIGQQEIETLAELKGALAHLAVCKSNPEFNLNMARSRYENAAREFIKVFEFNRYIINEQFDFNRLAMIIHKDNVIAGWWDDEHADNEDYFSATKIALIHSEATEMLEALRKRLRSDKIPNFSGLEEETADIIIRIMDFAGRHRLDLNGAIKAKMEYNANRLDHNREVRATEGGKKF